MRNEARGEGRSTSLHGRLLARWQHESGRIAYLPAVSFCSFLILSTFLHLGLQPQSATAGGEDSDVVERLRSAFRCAKKIHFALELTHSDEQGVVTTGFVEYFRSPKFQGLRAVSGTGADSEMLTVADTKHFWALSGDEQLLMMGPEEATSSRRPFVEATRYLARYWGLPKPDPGGYRSCLSLLFHYPQPHCALLLTCGPSDQDWLGRAFTGCEDLTDNPSENEVVLELNRTRYVIRRSDGVPKRITRAGSGAQFAATASRTRWSQEDWEGHYAELQVRSAEIPIDTGQYAPGSLGFGHVLKWYLGTSRADPRAYHDHYLIGIMCAHADADHHDLPWGALAEPGKLWRGIDVRGETRAWSNQEIDAVIQAHVMPNLRGEIREHAGRAGWSHEDQDALLVGVSYAYRSLIASRANSWSRPGGPR